MNFIAKMFNRRAKDNSNQIIRLLNLKPNWIIADIGSGGGYFSFEFAKKTIRGEVYAIDLNKKLLDFIKKQAEKQKLSNIKTIQIKNRVFLPKKVDLIFTRNVYHHLKDRIKYFKKLKENLKSSGILVIIDWKRKLGIIGHGTDKKIILNELKEAGYTLFKDFDVLPKQNFLIFKK